MLVRVMSYNPNRLYRYAEDSERFVQAEQVIQDANPDILLFQELYAPNWDKGVESVERLSAATGLQCKLDNGLGEPTYTFVKGNKSNYAIGLMWRPEITPVPESWRIIHSTEFWHGLGILAFNFNGVTIDHACYHAPPRVEREVRQVYRGRINEARLVVNALLGPNANPNILIGGDWNGTSADRFLGDYYDPLNFPEELDDEGAWLASRRTAGRIFLRSGLADVAVARAIEEDDHIRKPTVGHWISSKYGGRRIDIFRATLPLLRAISSYCVIDNDLTRAASDHLPIVTEYETKVLRIA